MNGLGEKRQRHRKWSVAGHKINLVSAACRRGATQPPCLLSIPYQNSDVHLNPFLFFRQKIGVRWLKLISEAEFDQTKFKLSTRILHNNTLVNFQV